MAPWRGPTRPRRSSAATCYLGELMLSMPIATRAPLAESTARLNRSANKLKIIRAQTYKVFQLYTLWRRWRTPVIGSVKTDQLRRSAHIQGRHTSLKAGSDLGDV